MLVAPNSFAAMATADGKALTLARCRSVPRLGASLERAGPLRVVARSPQPIRGSLLSANGAKPGRRWPCRPEHSPKGSVWSISRTTKVEDGSNRAAGGTATATVRPAQGARRLGIRRRLQRAIRPLTLARFGLVPQLVVPGGLVQQSHDRVPGRDRADEAQARVAIPHPGNSHRQSVARPQFNDHTRVRTNAGHAVKSQAVLRVVSDLDDTALAASIQECPDANGTLRWSLLATIAACRSRVVDHGASLIAPPSTGSRLATRADRDHQRAANNPVPVQLASRFLVRFRAYIPGPGRGAGVMIGATLVLIVRRLSYPAVASLHARPTISTNVSAARNSRKNLRSCRLSLSACRLGFKPKMGASSWLSKAGTQQARAA
jgi:hypothetical protein